MLIVHVVGRCCSYNSFVFEFHFLLLQSQSKPPANRADSELELGQLSLSTVFNNCYHTEHSNERITELEDELETWKSNYQQVKKRNRQLLVILQQGESG